MKYENYIFDLYGTLVDIHTNENKLGLWKKLSIWYCMKGAEYSSKELQKSFRKKIQKSEEELKSEFGEIQIAYVFRSLFEEKGVTVSDGEVNETGMLFRILSLEHIKLYPGAIELLAELKNAGKKVFLLSNAQRIFTIPEIHMLKLFPYFDGILLSSDAGVKKPSQKFYGQLFEKYNLSKTDSVMIGNDSVADIRGASDYGIDSRYIHTKQSPEPVKPLPADCMLVDSLEQTIKVLHNTN